MNSWSTDDMPVIRTDFSDAEAWASVRAAIRPSDGSGDGGDEGCTAYVEFVDDPAFEDLGPEQVLALADEDVADRHVCVFVVDRITLGSSEWPVLAIGLGEDLGSSFRVVASKLYLVENNLSIGNTDFCDFAEGVDDDGIFRGEGAPDPEEAFAAIRAAQATYKARAGQATQAARPAQPARPATAAYAAGAATAAQAGRPLGVLRPGGQSPASNSSSRSVDLP